MLVGDYDVGRAGRAVQDAIENFRHLHGSSDETGAWTDGSGTECGVADDAWTEDGGSEGAGAEGTRTEGTGSKGTATMLQLSGNRPL